jgi:hypothetical protein
MFLGWSLIPEIVYLAVRNQGTHLEVADHVGARQYLVTTSFTSMALTVAGASTALASALVWAVSDGLSTNDFRDLLASSLAALIIGALIWLPHWKGMEHLLTGEMTDSEFRALYGLRRTQLLTSIFVFGGVAVLTGLWVLGGAFSALFQATYAGATGWLPVLGPALFCAAAAGYHGVYYRNVEGSGLAQRFAVIPAAKVIEPAPPRVSRWVAPHGGMGGQLLQAPYGPPRCNHTAAHTDMRPDRPTAREHCPDRRPDTSPIRTGDPLARCFLREMRHEGSDWRLLLPSVWVPVGCPASRHRGLFRGGQPSKQTSCD